MLSVSIRLAATVLSHKLLRQFEVGYCVGGPGVLHPLPPVCRPLTVIISCSCSHAIVAIVSEAASLVCFLFLLNGYNDRSHTEFRTVTCRAIMTTVFWSFRVCSDSNVITRYLFPFKSWLAVNSPAQTLVTTKLEEGRTTTLRGRYPYNVHVYYVSMLHDVIGSVSDFLLSILCPTPRCCGTVGMSVLPLSDSPSVRLYV